MRMTKRPIIHPRRCGPLGQAGRLAAVLTVLVACQVPAHSEVPVSVFAVSAEEGSATASDRNERSTPLDSVLPVSPAIASDYGPSHDDVSVPLIKAVLLRLGYQVGRLDDRITARFKAAVFRYQHAHGIPSSGNLDEATLESLGIARK